MEIRISGFVRCLILYLEGLKLLLIMAKNIYAELKFYDNKQNRCLKTGRVILFQALKLNVSLRASTKRAKFFQSPSYALGLNVTNGLVCGEAPILFVTQAVPV